MSTEELILLEVKEKLDFSIRSLRVVRDAMSPGEHNDRVSNALADCSMAYRRVNHVLASLAK